MMDYGTAKAGLLYFTKALALQYARAFESTPFSPAPSGARCGPVPAESSISS